MNLTVKQWLVGILGLLFLSSLIVVAYIEGGKQRIQPEPEPIVPAESQACVTCHKEKTPVIVKQWQGSKHAKVGVACLECHQAREGDADAYLHEGKLIATIVTPRDCGACHKQIAEEFEHSHHARAGDILGSLDNVLGEIVEGVPAAVNGCQQCHGSKIRLLKDERGEVLRDDSGRPRIDPTTWPNTGMGRINLDGSRGACSACHSRHAFSKKMARQPEVCGKCHMGPDHPHIEIYRESKHGIAFRTMIDQMNLDSDRWVVGVDYVAAPTCATCHMSATKNQPITHDVGKRIAWTLRPVVSKKLENADKRREAMKDVCFSCHAPSFVNAFYKQYESTLELYNNKFAIPAQKIMKALRDAGRITPDQFDDPIEWTFFELWHHEGRRARMGASMMGPDYTQWHGFYEVAKHFYLEFIPEAEKLARGTKAEKVIREVLGEDYHRWVKGMSPELKKKIREFYERRYGKGETRY